MCGTWMNEAVGGNNIYLRCYKNVCDLEHFIEILASRHPCAVCSAQFKTTVSSAPGRKY